MLERIKDPTQRLRVRTVYNSSGQAVQQFDADDRLILSLNTPANPNQREVGALNPTGGQPLTTTVTYNEGGVPLAIAAPLGSGETRDFNFDLNPSQQANALGAVTGYSYAGNNLVGLTDAAGKTTTMAYDGLNNLTQIVDARGFTTTMTYSGTLLTRSTDSLGGTTLYTYTTAADAPEPPNLLRYQRDPGGTLTRYDYNSLGQPLTVTANYVDGIPDPNTPDEDRRTTYTYDALGRVLTVTGPEGLTTRNEYDPTSGNLLRVTQNYLAGQPAGYQNRYNLITAYGYDAAGRVVTTTTAVDTALARTDWTCYDGAGRVVKTVSNASGPNACDAGYSPSSDLNFDRITQTVYDETGNVIAVIDPLGKTTRTDYDELSRPVVVVDDLSGQAISANTPPAFDPQFPDRNVRTETVYDAAGNVLRTIDNAGNIPHTCYDVLNRAVKTIQNPSVADPCASYTPSSEADRDVTQQTVYDANSNAITTLDALGRITRTYYDPLNRPEYVVQNLIGQAIEVATPPAYDPQYPDRNLVTRTFYDAQGRAYRTLDLTSNRSDWTCYDDLGRVTKQVQNAMGDPCAAGYTPSTQPDEDVTITFVYDTAGHQIAVIAPDGQVTRTYYDATGRRTGQVVNLVGQPIAVATLPAFDEQHPDRNVTTLWGYDLLGRTVTTTLAAGSARARTDWTCYDVLGRAVKTVTNASGSDPCAPGYVGSGQPDEDLITQTVYDGAGNAIAAIDPTGKITRTYLDGLYRPTITVERLYGQAITNPTAPAYNSAYPDRNLRSTTRYDSAGRAFETVDNAGLVTRSNFDGVGRPVTETVNYVSGGPVDSVTNLRTVTGYDKNGNAIRRTDANGIMTAYEYDALGRLTAVVENYRPGFAASATINVRTEYRYDGRGRRVAIRE